MNTPSREIPAGAAERRAPLPTAALLASLAMLAGACFVEPVIPAPDEDGADEADSGETSDDNEKNCGNGTLEPTEFCDGQNLGDATCVSLGYEAGTLACTADCSFDVTKCTPMTLCGDGHKDPDEECDGEDFAGRICESFGYTGGTLACTADCVIDTSGCSDR